MSLSEETLMAYADGELNPEAAAEVETAMRDDPKIAQRIARHRALRATLQQAYAAELALPVPDRLLAAARAAPASGVDRPTRLPRWGFASMAAALLIGIGVAFFAWRHVEAPMIQTAGGARVAGGALDRGLSTLLSGESVPGSPVRIGLSFRAKSGDYCRAFVLVNAASGLACRHATRWEILALAPAPAAADSGYRTAGSALPEAIVAAVEARMAGEPMDRNGELEARARYWQAAPP